MRYLGPVQLHFIKESWNVKGDGDPGVHACTLINEVNTCAKNHVMSIGGNALLSYKLQAQESGGRAYRNQTYTIYTLTGDVALVLYDSAKLHGAGVTSTHESIGAGANIGIRLPSPTIATDAALERDSHRSNSIDGAGSVGTGNEHDGIGMSAPRKNSVSSAIGGENNIEF